MHRCDPGNVLIEIAVIFVWNYFVCQEIAVYGIMGTIPRVFGSNDILSNKSSEVFSYYLKEFFFNSSQICVVAHFKFKVKTFLFNCEENPTRFVKDDI